MAARAIIDTGQVAIRALRPIHRKGQPWTIQEGRIAGDSAEDAQAFADALVASMRAHREMEDARPAAVAAGKVARPAPAWPVSKRRIVETSVPLCHVQYHADGAAIPSYQSGWHHGGDTVVIRYADDVRVTSRLVDAPLPAPRRVAPAPVVAPVRKVAARKVAPRKVAPVAAAPVMAPTIVASDSIAPCDRCGRADWKSSNGRAWHVANNPECSKYRKVGRHVYVTA